MPGSVSGAAGSTSCLYCGQMEECPEWFMRDHICFTTYGTYALNGCMAGVCDFDEMGWECSC
jgi:hypothetical protein